MQIGSIWKLSCYDTYVLVSSDNASGEHRPFQALLTKVSYIKNNRNGWSYLSTNLVLLDCLQIRSKKLSKVIIVIHLWRAFTFEPIFLGGEFDGMTKSFEERVGSGRWVDYIFRQFPLVCLVGLAFLRFWAVILWILLSMITFIRPLFLIFQNPYVYLEDDWNIILADGFAINAWMLREQIVLVVCFVIGLLTLFIFNKKLINSTVETEKTTLLLGRYFHQK